MIIKRIPFNGPKLTKDLLKKPRSSWNQIKAQKLSVYAYHVKVLTVNFGFDMNKTA